MSQYSSDSLSLAPPTTQRVLSKHIPHTPQLARPISNRPNRYEFRIGAAYSGKANKFVPSRHHFSFDSTTSVASTGNPGSGKAHRIASGQDSFFVSRVGQTGAVAFAVTDGVGGWIDQGIDSADFSHGLCAYMAQSAQTFPEGHEEPGLGLNPQELLQTGYDKCSRDRSIIGGGTTACVAVAEPNGTLRVANLGDSGFIHLRPGSVHFASHPQTHAFNTPYQLSRMPPKLLTQLENFGGSAPLADTPDDADVTSHELAHGDVIVFGTDGVWDNLTPREILTRVESTMTSTGAWAAGNHSEAGKALVDLTERDIAPSDGETLQPLQTALAIQLTALAKAAGSNMKRDGPFARAVQKKYPRDGWRGGKEDDIAIVVAIVIDAALKSREAKL